MKVKIIADSSCDLTKDYLNGTNIDFAVVPLTINVKDKVFVDDENIDTHQLLEEVNKSQVKSTSSCPSVGDYQNELVGADCYFFVTISSKLSGSYNSARILQDQEKNVKISLIDSEATSGASVLIIDEIVRLVNEGLSFEEIDKQIHEFQKTVKLLFVLNRFDNLVKNGRMSKITAFVAQAFRIKPLCGAHEGEIKIMEKPRTIKAAHQRLVETIGKLGHDFKNRKCVITHVENEEAALNIKAMIEKEYSFKEVVVLPTRGLCSFYALNGGILVAF